MTTTITKWVTARGTKIEMHTEHITKEHIGTDDWTGNAITKDVDKIKVSKMNVNGNDFYCIGAHRTNDPGFRSIYMGNQVDNGRKVIMYIPLPSDIEKQIWGEWDEREAARKARKNEIIKKKAAAMKNRISSGYCTKCHSYCYGDCEAN